jgi:hypothetical protein
MSERAAKNSVYPVKICDPTDSRGGPRFWRLTIRNIRALTGTHATTSRLPRPFPLSGRIRESQFAGLYSCDGAWCRLGQRIQRSALA